MSPCSLGDTGGMVERCEGSLWSWMVGGQGQEGGFGFLFWLRRVPFGISVPRPGIEPKAQQ